jgi:hypothetical protein
LCYAVAGEESTGKKRKKVVEAAEEKKRDALEARLGIEGERMEVAPTKPTRAATVAVADKEVVEKEGDAPEAPSGIKGERVVEMAVVEEVAVAPALVVVVWMQEVHPGTNPSRMGHTGACKAAKESCISLLYTLQRH